MANIRIERDVMHDLRLDATFNQKITRNTKSWLPVAITSIVTAGAFIGAGLLAKYLSKYGLADRVIFPVISLPAMAVGGIAALVLTITVDKAQKNHRLLNYLQNGFEGTEERFKLIFSSKDDIRAVMSASILEDSNSDLSANEKKMLEKIRVKMQELNVY